MAIPIIQRSEVDAWLKAAKADGGYHKVRIAGSLEHVDFDMNKISKKGFSLADITADINEKLRNGYKFNDLTPLLKPAPGSPTVDRYEGKRVVDNGDEQCSITLIVGDAPRGSSDWANELQNYGAAIHTFCYEETDFLLDAAKEYATLSDDEVFKYRNIDDGDFVHNTLNFFSGGKNYTRGEVNTMKDQITTMVEELAQQIKNGEAPDLSKLQTKLTVCGVDVSITELMEYQKTGKELMDSFQYGHLGAPLSGASVAEHAKMGLAKSIAELYGSDKGELGKRFAEGIARVYEKAVARQEKNASSDFWQDGYWSSEAVNIQVDSAKLFGHMKTDSKESMTRDLSEKLNQLQSRIRAYCYSFGNQFWYAPNGSGVNLNNTMKTIQDYFHSWMKKIG